MSCQCQTIYHTFVNETESTVPFAGAVPTVTVSYLIDGEWLVSVAVVVKLQAGAVFVAHGGPSTGVIKIMS